MRFFYHSSIPFFSIEQRRRVWKSHPVYIPIDVLIQYSEIVPVTTDTLNYDHIA